jgi:hypothetical protein
MRLPSWLVALSFAGLIPFLAGPVCVFAGWEPAALDVDLLWRSYVALIAVFLAGTFWGFALIAVNGPAGAAGVLIASLLVLLSWGASLLSFRESLAAFAVVYLLLLLADFWRERALDTIPGYFRLRAVLTGGALISIVLRLAQP